MPKIYKILLSEFEYVDNFTQACDIEHFYIHLANLFLA